jgi:hypothetical protein
MGKNFNVAVLRARVDTSVPVISDDACFGVIVANSDRNAVFQYWEQVGEGYYSFDGSRMFPWVDIELDPSEENWQSRDTLYRKAKAATEDAGNHLGEYSAIFVLCHPATVTAQSVVIPFVSPPTVTVNLDVGETTYGGLGVAVLNTASTVTDMCHELGHAIGWDHTFGVWNNGIDWDGVAPFTGSGEYGDPYDLMSSASFGTRYLDPAGPRYSGNAEFAADAPPVWGWPDPVPWRGMGPGIARAHLHLQAPEALDGMHRVRHVHLPGPGEGERVTLTAAMHADGGATTLVAVHPPDEHGDGRGRYYVEYRDTSGWDQGLQNEGTDLSRRAVVLHRLEAVNGVVRCWYQGRIVVPLEIDVDASVRRLPLAVRVVEVGTPPTWVVVELVRTDDRSVVIDRSDEDEVVGFDEQRVDRVDTICGPLEARWGNRRVVTTSTFSAHSYGFGGAGLGTTAPPAVQWTVGGQAAGSGSTSLTLTPEPGRDVVVQAVVDDASGRLTLSNRPEDGRYRVDVVATVTERNGGFPTASAPEPYEPDGLRAGYEHSIHQQLDACIRQLLNDLRVRPNEIFMPPRDSIRPGDGDRLQRLKLEAISARVARFDPLAASELQHLVALRYGALPR